MKSKTTRKSTRLRHDESLTHLLTRKGRYACGVGKGHLHTSDPSLVTCDKCKQTTAFRKEQLNALRKAS